jgi:hypothetical protein
MFNAVRFSSGVHIVTRLYITKDPQNVHTELSITTYSQLAALLALLLDTRYIDVFALSDIIESMLLGPAGQVTVANHQRAYNTLRHGIRHYSDGASFHEWIRTSEVVFKGVINKDRDMRLAAG